MWKIFAALLLATSLYSVPAHARDGGAEPMPGISFTDMPSVPTQPVKPTKHRHIRWRRGCFCAR